MYTDIDQAYNEQIQEAEQLVREGTLIAARVIKFETTILMEFVTPDPFNAENWGFCFQHQDPEDDVSSLGEGRDFL